jgi:hypothetical protein
MEKKVLTERKKTVASKLGNLMKRIALHELERDSIEPQNYGFTLEVSSFGNHVAFRVYSNEKNSLVESEDYYGLYWINDPTPYHFDSIIYRIETMEALFIKYSNLNK